MELDLDTSLRLTLIAYLPLDGKSDSDIRVLLNDIMLNTQCGFSKKSIAALLKEPDDKLRFSIVKLLRGTDLYVFDKNNAA